MKIALIYPSRDYRYTNAFLPPLVLAQLAALTPDKHEVVQINDSLEVIDYDAGWDLAAITCMTVQADRAYEISAQFRMRGIKVVMGGIHPTQFPEEAQHHADALVLNEAEDIWRQVLDDAQYFGLRERYDGVPWSMQTEVIPDWGGHDLSKYMRLPWLDKPLMPIMATRGCPFGCEYCVVTSIHGKTYRTRPVEHIIKEIDSTDAMFYFFVDDNLMFSPRYGEELMDALIAYRNSKTGKDITWFCQASMTVLKKPHLVEKMSRAGCVSVLPGIETINQDTLNNVSKSFNKADKYTELFQLYYYNGIVPYISLMFGFDEDTHQCFPDTLDFLRRNDIMLSVWWLLCPVPGTPLYEQFKREERLFNRPWKEYDAGHVIAQPKNFEAQDLHDTYWRTYLDYYNNLGAINQRVKEKYPLPLGGYAGALMFQRYAKRQVMAKSHPFAMGGV